MSRPLFFIFFKRRRSMSISSNTHHPLMVFGHYISHLGSLHVGGKKGGLVLAAVFGGAFILDKLPPSLSVWGVIPLCVGPLVTRFGNNAQDWQREAYRLTGKSIFDLKRPTNWVRFNKHIELVGETITFVAFAYNSGCLMKYAHATNSGTQGIIALLLGGFGIWHANGCATIIQRAGGKKKLLAAFREPRNG
jgi:hypothetical protein